MLVARAFFATVTCFNEAPAYYEGLQTATVGQEAPFSGFNEAPAYYEGLPHITGSHMLAHALLQ